MEGIDGRKSQDPRMAMGYKFGDTARSYYETNSGKIKLPDFVVHFIYEIFDRIIEKDA